MTSVKHYEQVDVETDVKLVIENNFNESDVNVELVFD